MKKQPLTDESLLAELRSQAGAFRPVLPPGLRRRVFEALAEVDAEARAARRSPWPARWLATAACVALVAIVTLSVARTRAPQQPVVIGPEAASTLPVLTRTSLAVADPGTLAQRYLGEPLEAEVENLLAGLTRTRDTVVRVLPAPVKRARPATRPPVGA